MADYLTSDVHLTHEALDRSARFAGFVDRLDAADRLTIVGDLCDFWFASRQRRLDPMRCDGLRALADFRGRGGELTVILGNHDGALGPLYRSWLGAEIVDEPVLMESHGIRLHLVHGHRVGARKPWKAFMEGPAFLRAFGGMPGPIARLARTQLDRKNLRDLAATHERYLAKYRRVVADPTIDAELFLFGHVHERFDERVGARRLVVLGDWFDGSPFARIDQSGFVLATSDETPPLVRTPGSA